MNINELEIYKKSLSLLKEIEVVKQFDLERDIISQIFRSARSICAQISEGFAKRSSQKEFVRYLFIALGSSDETVNHLRVIYQLKRSDEIIKLGEEYRILSKQINSLIQTIKNKNI